MKDTRTFSKAKLIIILSTIICLAIVLTICITANHFSKDKNDNNDNIITESTTVIEDIYPDETPLFDFDTRECAQELINAFDRGEIAEVEILYDQGGANTPVVSNNPKIIQKAFESVNKVSVLGESNMSITDSYHYIYFTMSDGTSCGYSFEGENILVYSDDSDSSSDRPIEYKNYNVKGTNEIWNLYWDLVE